VMRSSRYGVSTRNLLNYCAEGFVPDRCGPFYGGGRGTAAFYRAESVPMIRPAFRDYNGKGAMLTRGSGDCGSIPRLPSRHSAWGIAAARPCTERRSRRSEKPKRH